VRETGILMEERYLLRDFHLEQNVTVFHKELNKYTVGIYALHFLNELYINFMRTRELYVVDIFGSFLKRMAFLTMLPNIEAI
jgi:hypothetical protein